MWPGKGTNQQAFLSSLKKQLPDFVKPCCGSEVKWGRTLQTKLTLLLSPGWFWKRLSFLELDRIWPLSPLRECPAFNGLIEWVLLCAHGENGSLIRHILCVLNLNVPLDCEMLVSGTLDAEWGLWAAAPWAPRSQGERGTIAVGSTAKL